ncbi:hypothetical protein BGZ83_004134 [Gryganskiella cystojenkinii]|nr:hypothetical protein BGZ83_004134 [Gryganskiella cystojenkinii]
MTKSVFQSNDLSSPFKVEIDHSQEIVIKQNRRPLAIFHGSVNSPATIKATVTFEAEKDYHADGVQILFQTVVNTDTFEAARDNSGMIRQQNSPVFTKEILGQQTWTLPVRSSTPGIISKGRYTTTVTTRVNPTLPSSSLHPQSGVRYFFKVLFLHNLPATKLTKANAVAWVESDIWVLNSTLPPSIDATPVEKAMAHVVVTGAFLPITFSADSKILTLGQVAALTVQVHPFQTNSSFKGHEPNITSVQFTLLETRRLRDKRSENKTPDDVLEVLAIGLPKSSWPKSMEGWEKTVKLTLPSSPQLSVDTTSKYLDIYHEMVLTMTVKTNSGGLFMKTEEVKVKLDVQVVAPRPVEDQSTLPDYYTSAIDGTSSSNNNGRDLGRDEKRGFSDERSTAPDEDLPEYPAREE